MDSHSARVEEYLANLRERIGQRLDFGIYLDDQPVAAVGHLISAELIDMLTDIAPRRLRFSREELSVETQDGLVQELVENIKKNPVELVLEAGIPEDLTQEARSVATQKVKEIFESCRYLTKLDLTSIADLATSLIDRVSSFESVTFKLHDLHSYDEYTYYHSVNVCVLGTTLFHDFVANEEELVELGIGLLLHDIGKSKIDLKILNKPARLTEDEFAVVTRHALYGYNLVKAHKEVSPLALDIVLNHHERSDGTGYTRGLRESQLSFFDMVAAVCDVFDAVTTDRFYRSKMDVHRAVSILIRGSGSHFNTRVVNHFLQGIGRFPVGTFVLLSSGETGVVSRINSNALSLPVIRVVFNENGTRLTPPVTVDLFQQSDIYITRPLDISFMPEMHKYIDTNMPV